MRDIRINVISESEFLPKEHGVHTAYLNHVAMLKRKNVKILVNSLKNTDITHIHTVGPLGLHKLIASPKAVVSAHVIPASFEGSIVGTAYWLGSAKRYLRFFYNKANLVLAVAPRVKTELEKIGVTGRIEIFPNVIDTLVFRPNKSLRMLGRKRLGIDENKKVVLGVGQVQPRKGTEDFIKVARQLPQFTFVWVGNKPFRVLTAHSGELEGLLKSLPKNFIFIGGLSYSRMSEIYNAADIFFFPSYQENASMAIIEAAACGLPLVLRDLAEYRLLYKEGYIKGRNNSEFKASLKTLFSNSSLLEQQRRESIKLAEKFSFDALGGKLLEYYGDL